MKTSKILSAAIMAKENGYKFMASVVKSHFTTTYYHVVSIDAIIKTGKWIPANFGQTESGAHCRLGQSQLPDKTILRTTAIFNLNH